MTYRKGQNGGISPATRITQEIIARLEAGTKPWIKPRRGVPVSRPMRACGISYRGMNVFWLWMVADMCGYASSYWMTYNQAEKLGAQVETVADGAEAVARAAEATFDLILMDCAMPELDGIQATRQIRALAGPRSRVPIVALTALASDTDREACLRHGMDGYIVKPFNLSALRETLARLTVPTTQDDLLPSGGS